jgi:hypothetical protein
MTVDDEKYSVASIMVMTTVQIVFSLAFGIPCLVAIDRNQLPDDLAVVSIDTWLLVLGVVCLSTSVVYIAGSIALWIPRLNEQFKTYLMVGMALQILLLLLFYGAWFGVGVHVLVEYDEFKDTTEWKTAVAGAVFCGLFSPAWLVLKCIVKCILA